ncbi:putative ribonuclease H-like domain-containing protein [Tanacetum coccineum]
MALDGTEALWLKKMKLQRIKHTLMAMSSSSSDNKVYDDSYCSKSCRKNTENLTTKISKLRKELFDSESNLCNYKRGLSQVEARLVEFKINESKFCEKIRVLDRDLELKDYKIENLTNDLEEVKKERDGIDSKLEKFVNSSKDLDQMLKSQKSGKDKKGVRFDEYRVILPHPAQVYSSPMPYFSWTGLPEFADNIVADYTRPTPSVDVTNDVPTARTKNPTVGLKVPTAKPTIAAVKGNKGKAIKASARWIWKPKQISGEGSNFNGGKPLDNIDDKGFWDSGCSRHMTGNISYLSDYEPYDGGYVSFRYGVYVDDIIFGLSNPKPCRKFEALMHDKFKMSDMGKLSFFLGLQVLQKKDGIFLSQDKYVGDILKKFGFSDLRSANTPMDRENPWGKDGTGKDVDLYLYRSMIGSLMYLTASRPDIMFAVCTCARHQVTPKECHLHAVKRIFRYLKGHPKLGLWYPKESPFDLVAYSDSDYGGANDNVADLLTKAFDVGRFQYLVESRTADGETNILAKINGKQRTISESSIRRYLKLNDEEGISTLLDNELFENLSLMGYNILPNQRFSFQKDETAPPIKGDRYGEAFPTATSKDADS